MLIKGVEIRVIKTGTVKSRGTAVVCAGKVIEKTVRCACAHALAKSRSRGVSSAIFSLSGCQKEGLSVVSIAKIAAQEIFCYIRQEKRKKNVLREIIIVLFSDRDLKIFQKIVFGYLRHVVDTLCWGPFVTVDMIIEVTGGIVLIKRSNPPFGWALPGGFVEENESLEDAACREAKEETGLCVRSLRQLHTYSDPSRDPRFHTITTVFIGRAKGKPRASSDAAEAKIFRLGAWEKLELAFDHRQVLKDYLRYKSR